jgi:hypothetical protein
MRLAMGLHGRAVQTGPDLQQLVGHSTSSAGANSADTGTDDPSIDFAEGASGRYKPVCAAVLLRRRLVSVADGVPVKGMSGIGY